MIYIQEAHQNKCIWFLTNDALQLIQCNKRFDVTIMVAIWCSNSLVMPHKLHESKENKIHESKSNMNLQYESKA